MPFLLINIYQKLLIAALALIVALAVLILIWKLIARYQLKHNLPNAYFRVINKVALYKDFYLINILKLKIDSNQYITYDHILFGNKYIYAISDTYYNGELRGDINQPKLTLIESKNRKGREIDNPLYTNRYRLEKLALATGIELEMLINVVVVNDECDLTKINNNDFTFIINRCDFYRLIDAIESREVRLLNPEQLNEIVQDIDRLNQRKKSKI
ncbi:MAG TPA: NERD domain-containing protein [Bacilli bacterium]|nr:NERD domain-containing protein [Bacilli bacterium]